MVCMKIEFLGYSYNDKNYFQNGAVALEPNQLLVKSFVSSVESRLFVEP